MGFFKTVDLKLSRAIVLGVMLSVVFIIACGGAAEPTAAPAAPTSAPQAAAQPTAMPEATSPPEVMSPEVNPGKVTWMVGSFANERMTYCLAGGGGHDYGRQIHAFLLESDVKDGARFIVPGIASKWSVNSDGTSWTVEIREGVKFHDGTELDIDDVLWTWRWGMGPQAKDYATGGACLSNSQLTESFEKTGPNEANVTFNTVFLDFEDDFGSAGGNWIGTIYPAGLGEGPDILHDEAVEAAFDRNPIGAGQFTLEEHVASDKMVFERFDDHYYTPANGLREDRRPRFQTLEIRLAPEVATRVAAVRAGEADIAPVTLGAQEQIEAGGGRLLFGQEGAFFFARLLGCWEEQYPCHDIRVRQALNYTVDRVSMRDKLYRGPEVFQIKGFPNVTPSTVGYSSDIDPFPYDPDKGRELMIAAGYAVPGTDGKDFGKFIINTWPSAAVPNLPEAAQFVAEVWKKELGIDAEVRVSEESAVKKLTRLTEDAYGQVLFRDNETRLDGSGILVGGYGRTPDRPDRSSRDPDVVALAKEIRVIVDPAVRVPRLNEFYIRARNESNELMMGVVNIPWGVGPRILTWEPTPLAFYVNGVHTITLK
jgi:ABC-type transport system substrate-binding protein